jgi:hypothetical protein
MDRGAVCYARADGSLIKETIFPIMTPNGIGLSADGGRLYVAGATNGLLRLLRSRSAWCCASLDQGYAAYRPAEWPLLTQCAITDRGGLTITAYASPAKCVFAIIDYNARALQKFVERDDFWAPCIAWKKFKQSKFRFVNAMLGVELPEIADD